MNAAQGLYFTFEGDSESSTTRYFMFRYGKICLGYDVLGVKMTMKFNWNASDVDVLYTRNEE